MRQDLADVLVGDAGIDEHLLGKIEPAHLGVLIEVAQDIGHLQGAAEMMRQEAPLLLLNPEDLDRKPSRLRRRRGRNRDRAPPSQARGYRDARPFPCRR